MRRLIGLVMSIGVLLLSFTGLVYAAETTLPDGVKAVEVAGGETRYRLSGEDPNDPRTYTYEQVLLEEEGYEPEGKESYDGQDDYHDVVTISNLDAFTSYYWDGYCTQNLKVYLANYLYYFAQDEDAYYSGSIVENSFKDSTDYGGIIKFDVNLEDTLIHCEYHKKFRLFGFDSDYGDMSLEAQFVITEKGYDVSRETLLKYADGELVSLTPQSGNDKWNPTDRVYINSVEWQGQKLVVDDYFYIDEGADVSLLNCKNYTEANVNDMLLCLREKGGNRIRYTDCQEELWKFYIDTKVDVAGLLAIAESEGMLNAEGNAAYWNFFNCKTPPGGTSIGNTGMWNARADCKTMGEALVMEFQWIYRNYLLQKQDSFYKMSFGDYGYPASAGEAQGSVITHSYRPWFTDRSYIESGYEDYYAWCNKCARYREELIHATYK